MTVATDFAERLPSDKAGAALLGFAQYFTGKPCKRGHVDVRSAKNGDCRSCSREYTRQWKKANRGKTAAQKKRRYWANRETDLERRRRQYWANLERERESNRQYWVRNPDRRRSAKAHRRAAKLQRTPPWANQEAIRLIYAIAARVTRETGVKHHVDHYYPLQGKTVSGLHVPENLQLLTAHENMVKHNRMPPQR